MHSHFLQKFLKETFHFSGCWLLQKCPLYGNVRFIVSPSQNQKSSKVNMKYPLSVMTYQVQIYWKDQKMERLNELESFFHSKLFKQGSLH